MEDEDRRTSGETFVNVEWVEQSANRVLRILDEERGYADSGLHLEF
jgi:hypothetical protein